MSVIIIYSMFDSFDSNVVNWSKLKWSIFLLLARIKYAVGCSLLYLSFFLDSSSLRLHSMLLSLMGMDFTG